MRVVQSFQCNRLLLINVELDAGDPGLQGTRSPMGETHPELLRPVKH